jgi:hypothetical protein
MLRDEGDLERRIRHDLPHPALAFPDLSILNFETPRPPQALPISLEKEI